MEHFALAGSTGHRSMLNRSFHRFESRSGETTLRISKSRSDGHALAYSSSRHFNDGVRPDLVLRNITHDIVSISSTVPLTQGVGAGLHVLWVPQNYWSGMGYVRAVALNGSFLNTD